MIRPEVICLEILKRILNILSILFFRSVQMSGINWDRNGRIPYQFRSLKKVFLLLFGQKLVLYIKSMIP